MTQFYSPSTGSIYPAALLSQYSQLPDDMIEISDDSTAAIVQARTDGLPFVLLDDGSVSVAPDTDHDLSGKKWVLNEQRRALAQAQAEISTKQQMRARAQRSLQAHIDSVAQSLGFSNGNSVILYAGFDNPFKTLAQAFGAWEAGIWAQANQYLAQVKSGDAPMLTPEQAVERVPSFDFTGA